MSNPPFLRTNYADQAVEELPDVFYKEEFAPNLHALIRSSSAPFQQIEETIWDWMQQLDIDKAGTYRLDILGQILHELREDLDNDDYRKVLKAKRIAVTIQANGSGPDLRKMVEILANPEGIFYVDIEGHREIYIQYVVKVALSPAMRRKILKIMSSAVTQGIRFQISEGYTFAFGWEGDLDTRGFSRGKYATVLT